MSLGVWGEGAVPLAPAHRHGPEERKSTRAYLPHSPVSMHDMCINAFMRWCDWLLIGYQGYTSEVFYG